MTGRLIEAYGRIPKLVSQLHLPVQSGSDRVLKRNFKNEDLSDRGLVGDALKDAVLAAIAEIRPTKPDAQPVTNLAKF